MNVELFCEGIGLPAQALEAVRPWLPDKQRARTLWQAFLRDTPAFLAQWEREEQAPQKILALYLTFACGCWDAYAQRGIAPAVYWDTFRDIALWDADCRARTGAHGLRQGAWLARHLHMALFRLGRLQFEPAPFPAAQVQPGTPAAGARVLFVHVPADGPLAPQPVADSYAQAVRFFGPDSFACFACDSWLLSPVLLQLLAADSNILRFQREYRILRVNEASRQAEERIFGFVSDRPEEYPCASSLQRAAAARLCAGEKIPSGFGIRPSEGA